MGLSSQRLRQISPENLEINRSGKGLELIAEVAQTLQPFVDIEKTSVGPASPIPRNRWRQ